MSSLMLRAPFIKYYELRRRIRAWQRRITYRPGITFNRRFRIRIMKLAVLWMAIWHFGSGIVYAVFFRKELKETPFASPIELFNRRWERKKEIIAGDDPLFEYKSIISNVLGSAKLRKGADNVQKFKQEFPLDEW